MQVNIMQKNSALVALFNDPKITIFLDANIIIPPDRRSVGARSAVDFRQYIKIWLEPLFDEFPNLAIHESVYDEFVSIDVKKYVDSICNDTPPKLKIYTDDMLVGLENVLFQTHINNLSKHSKYVPSRDNSNDRGEIRTLSFMATKGFLYFAANDSLAIRLIERAESLHSGLDDMSVLKPYEIIYYLYTTGKYNNKGLRALYKYLYNLKESEKKRNPEWNVFKMKMDKLYSC